MAVRIINRLREFSKAPPDAGLPAHFRDEQRETGRLRGRLREGQVARKELSGGSAVVPRSKRSVEARCWRRRRRRRGELGPETGSPSSERGSARGGEREARRPEPGAQPPPAPGVPPASPFPGRVAARGLVAARGTRSAARPPARPGARLAGARLPLRAVARLPGSRRHRLLVPGRRCNPGRTLLHFAGRRAGCPLHQPRRAGPGARPEQPWWRERKSGLGFAGCHCSGWQLGRRPPSGRAERDARVAEGDPGACRAPRAEFASGRDPLGEGRGAQAGWKGSSGERGG